MEHKFFVIEQNWPLLSECSQDGPIVDNMGLNQEFGCRGAAYRKWFPANLTKHIVPIKSMTVEVQFLVDGSLPNSPKT